MPRTVVAVSSHALRQPACCPLACAGVQSARLHTPSAQRAVSSPIVYHRAVAAHARARHRRASAPVLARGDAQRSMRRQPRHTTARGYPIAQSADLNTNGASVLAAASTFARGPFLLLPAGVLTPSPSAAGWGSGTLPPARPGASAAT
eukprot:680840-Pleurochrysis_carterae.AAC.4